MSPLIIAFLPIVGVVVGSLTQFFLSQKTEQRKHLQQMRATAYADFLRALALSAIARKHSNTEKSITADELAIDAKQRIVIYGTAEVIAALAEFDNVGTGLSNPLAQKALLRMVAAMRMSTDSKSSALPFSALSTILFGSRHVSSDDSDAATSELANK
ncbi:hypothetical protein [Stigmatella aurantiaca]|uniref:hypothetical protein n=1 Tax=Stigmatella aurantiaca TaxID=41 RepID=UPI0011D23AAD|nr:hypothetical protein [Stigmatella aurantiaca]